MFKLGLLGLKALRSQPLRPVTQLELHSSTSENTRCHTLRHHTPVGVRQVRGRSYIGKSSVGRTSDQLQLCCFPQSPGCCRRCRFILEVHLSSQKVWMCYSSHWSDMKRAENKASGPPTNMYEQVSALIFAK